MTTEMPVRPKSDDKTTTSATTEVSTITFTERATPVVRRFRTPLAVCGGLAVASAVLLLLGADPLQAWTGIVTGSIGSFDGIIDTVRQTVPVALIALGVAISFRAGLWNAGGEGQFLVGAVAAVVVGITVPLPPGLHALVAVAAAVIAGSVYSVVPGLLREYRGASEILTTLMLNFVAALLVGFVISGPLSATFSPATVPVQPSAEIPGIALGPGRVLHPGVFVVIVATALLAVAMRRSRFGLDVDAVGANGRAADLMGFNTRAIRLKIFALAGALAGMSGGLQVLGVQKSLIDGISPNYGFTAIVAALLGGLRPVGTVVASIAMSALLVGGQSLQRSTDLGIAAVWVIEGALLLTLLGARVIGRTERSWR